TVVGRERVEHIIIARRRRGGPLAVRFAVAEVCEDNVQTACVVRGPGNLHEVIEPIGIRWQPRPSKPGADRLGISDVLHLERTLPACRTAAVCRWRAGHHQDLIAAESGFVAVTERDIDRPVRSYERVRALILITGVRVGLATAHRTVTR